ncbi:hypothetical protein CERZMDRAFT_101556 [Cercospora zeae-maydis SCOH1-5]|uniref:Uncharacterized protein n=1 Tax=Cercospora zeae-maydis SCOH1-5 TaxID=717836 RepID=A0A6A6F4Z2_9PEZI|nr:hypothetical protein CERZMDRAFT_101556 [Cercospora zeae-maydis SCOH1-5]
MAPRASCMPRSPYIELFFAVKDLDSPFRITPKQFNMAKFFEFLRKKFDDKTYCPPEGRSNFTTALVEAGLSQHSIPEAAVVDDDGFDDSDSDSAASQDNHERPLEGSLLDDLEAPTT